MSGGCFDFINQDCLWWIILIVAIVAILSDDGCDHGCGCNCNCVSNNSCC